MEREADAYQAYSWLGTSEEFDREEEGASADFLYGPQDSFNNYAPPGASASLIASCNASDPAAIDYPQVPDDWVSLITTISQVYRQHGYLDMRRLDNVDFESIGVGSVFHVSSSDLEFNVVSSVDSTRLETVVNKVVIKRVKDWSLSETNIRSFTRELRILHHLQGTDNIVRLRGIGWFYNWETIHHLPEPVFVLEEAEQTLRDLVSPDVNLLARTMLSIFYDVTKGLSALHQCGIVHGDVKPDNVLLFNSTRLEQGVQVRTFVAKLSDFSLAILDNGGRQYLPGGTMKYLAPEAEDHLTFDELKLTDVYSLGVLFAMVASRTEDVLSLDAVSLIETDLAGIAEQVLRQTVVDTEGSTLTQSEVDLVRRLFRNTLRQNPRERDLPGLLRSFEAAFNQTPTSPAVATILRPELPRVDVSYAKFNGLSGHIKDYITEGLLKVHAAGETDPRYALACFELAVIYISKYSSPTTTYTEGLEFLWAAAESGDLRARALYGRLRDAFDATGRPEYPHRRQEWLSSAARAGYRIAQGELAEEDREIAQQTLREYARACIEALFSKQSANPFPSLLEDHESKNAAFEAHLFAGTGEKESLAQLLMERPNLLNHQNHLGDTPLLTASRFGCFETASLLLSQEADASISNNSGENSLHFLWRFTLHQADLLLVPLLEAGANLDQVAALSQPGPEWNLASNLKETPIERAASYRRLDLVKLLLERGRPIIPRNGNQLRRMLLLAIRLQDVGMQEFLIQYASDHHAPGFGDDLRPLARTTWEYKGRRRSYAEASVLGWVVQTATGAVDVPLAFWQASCHGRGWRTAMKQTIGNALRLGGDEVAEKSLDRVAVFAANEGAHDALEHLISLKILHTDGERGRLRTLSKLWWEDRRRPPGFGDNDNNASDEGKAAHNLGDKCINRTIRSIQYIDQIYHGYTSETLAQTALRRGDRRLFHILAWRFGADLALPFREHLWEHNCYSALANSQHQDMWFAHELHALGIHFNCPEEFFETTEDPDRRVSFQRWRHPLQDSINCKSWPLTNWLLSQGASVFDNADALDKTVMDLILDKRSVPDSTVNFLFTLDDPERDFTWWAPRPRDVPRGGYPMFRTIYKAIDLLYSIKHSRGGLNAAQCETLATLWLSLLEQYLNVEDPDIRDPRVKDSIYWDEPYAVITMTTELFQHFFSNVTSFISFRIAITPAALVKVTISADGVRLSPYKSSAGIKRQSTRQFATWMVRGSPLDKFPLSEWLASRLWAHGYFPSLHYPGSGDVIQVVVVAGGILGAFSWLIAGLLREEPGEWLQTQVDSGVMFIAIVFGGALFCLFAGLCTLLVGGLMEVTNWNELIWDAVETLRTVLWSCVPGTEEFQRLWNLRSVRLEESDSDITSIGS